jgi:N-acetylglucosamine-6-phosphate deacetylase
MSKIVIQAGKLVCDEKTVMENGFLYVEDGIIQGIAQDNLWQSKDALLIDCSPYIVFPGLIDIHIHGAMGRDFVEGSQEVVTAVSRDVLKDGVTAYVASLTVVSHERMLEILESLSQAVAPIDGARYLGIHAEGPYISKEFKALMNELYIREPDVNEFAQMIESAEGKLLQMTYSPHFDTSGSLLELATKYEVKMMIGHSEASCQQALDALTKGASGFTHFYNAMSGHHHRKEGVVTAGFLAEESYAEIIADTVHVSPAVLKFTYDLLGSKKLILITDAMPGKSMADGTFYFSDLESIKKEGKAYVKATGRLAGSVIGLNEALYNMKEICGCDTLQLVEMACINPAKLLGLNDCGSLTVGKRADIAVFNENYDCVMTLVAGEMVFRNA